MAETMGLACAISIVNWMVFFFLVFFLNNLSKNIFWLFFTNVSIIDVSIAIL